MVNPIRLNNYLNTTKIAPGSCVGFDDEAFGALLGLVGYRSLTDRERFAWVSAINAARTNDAGATQAGPKAKSFFYSAVWNRKNSAFGNGTDVPPLKDIDLVAYPWVLDDATFEVLDAEVVHGKGLAGKTTVGWDDLLKKVRDLKDQYGLATPVAGAAGAAIGSFVRKYAPQLFSFASTAAQRVSGIGAAVAFSTVTYEQWAIRMNNQLAQANFEVDRKRRDYDKANPILPKEVS